MAFRFCSLASGSSGNCQYIETNRLKLLIDAGLSGRKIESSLKTIGVSPESINGILVTHEHKDHIKGVGILSRRYNLPIYANENTWKAMENDIGKINVDNIRTFKTEEEFELGDLGILPFKTSHDSIESVGFCFYHKNKKISLVTDTGFVNQNIKKKIYDSDLLVIESNHDIEMLKMGRYPWFLKKRIMGDTGHLSNDLAGEVISEVFSGKRQRVLLAHLSKENNFPELAYQTVVNILIDKGIKIGDDIIIGLTQRDNPTKIYNL
ncbi:MBL fold metallo-hydrolase [Caloranaerobacter azorensis]|uniref:MBL fold metallo-hydrolase n=1 Tax=Caloranaerobacter azorensis TaxID=116090 RepID=A0A6P1YG48_9FIRM|nr:MBL fold metallo-hydrolase [Caloranaerobacter azorensis]QIB27922.1 MBL fold metallo-hydrolase [Caloranaerobacter azorensis]